MSQATEAAQPKSKQRQLDVLRHSGWGVPFRIFQPRNLCFWVLLLGYAGGVTVALQSIRPTAPAYSSALDYGVVLFAIYAVPWWLYLSHLNRYTTVPHKIILTAFLWGFLAATFWIALRANDAILTIYAKAFGNAWASDWGPALTAPFTEETAKMLGLVLLLGLVPQVLRTPFDGFITGAFIGLGFQISEDILYGFQGATAQFGLNQGSLVGQTLLVRGLAGLFSHTMFSAIYCAGLMWLLNRDGSDHRLRGLGLMALATVFHLTWDSGGVYFNHVLSGAGPVILNYVLTIVLSLVTIRLLLRTVRRDERGWVRDVLEPEVEAGVLTPAEVGVLSGGWKERRKLLHSVSGHRTKQTVKHVIAAAEDLASQIAHAGGQDTDAVVHARAEVARVRSGAQA
jgi:RsiW-degrading membrane proteinase PrsW (M82 family)